MNLLKFRQKDTHTDTSQAEIQMSSEQIRTAIYEVASQILACEQELEALIGNHEPGEAYVNRKDSLEYRLQLLRDQRHSLLELADSKVRDLAKHMLASEVHVAHDDAIL